MSKQPRQTVRKKIRINEEKSIPGTSCPAASAVGERPARSALSLLGEKVFAHETREEATILLPEFFGQIHSLFRQNGYSYGVAVCCAALKISSASLLPTDRELTRAPAGAQLEPKKLGCWDLHLFPAGHRHQRLSAWDRLSAHFCCSSHPSIQCWVSSSLLFHSSSFHNWRLLKG